MRDFMLFLYIVVFPISCYLTGLIIGQHKGRKLGRAEATASSRKVRDHFVTFDRRLIFAKVRDALDEIEATHGDKPRAK